MSSPAPSSSSSAIPKKRRLWPWAMALVLIAAGGWYASQRGGPPEGEDNGNGKGKSAAGRPGGPGGRGDRPTPVSLATIGTADIRVQVPAIGTVVPRNQAVVRARVDGPLLEVAFTEGKPVAAGEVLARIDPEPFKAALAQARGQLARDAALLKNAQLDLDRYKGLLAQDSIAKQQVDTQAALVQQYKGTVQADEAAVKSAELQLSYTTVKAPIAGRAGLRSVDPGNIVKASDTAGLVTHLRGKLAAFDGPANFQSVHLGQAQVDTAVLAQRAAAKEPGKNLLMPKPKVEEEDTRRSPWRGGGKGRR